MPRKKEDILVKEEADKLAKLQFRSLTVRDLQSSLDNVMMSAIPKMEEIIHSDEVFFHQIEGKAILRIVETRDKVAAFNAIINAGKYLETRKSNEREEGPGPLDFSGFDLIDGGESKNIGLYPASSETEDSTILDR